MSSSNSIPMKPTPTPPPTLVAPCAACDIEIVDETGNPITTKQTKRVGEKIVLVVRIKSGSCGIGDVLWTLPGAIVKDYQDNSTTAKVTLMDPADKTKTSIAFYWVDGADGRNVSVSCVCTGSGANTNKSTTATFDVKAPTLDKFDSVTATVQFDDAAAPAWVRFGVTTGGIITTSGIKWNWKVTVPTGVDGFLKDVQTIQDITKRTASGKKQVWTFAGTKVPPTHVQLDTTNPYSMPGDFHATKGFPQKVTAGTSYTDDYTSDSPGTPLAGTTAKSVHDTFRYFIMYKPDTVDAIWVPVAVADWSWEAEATSAAGAWTLVAKNSSTNPSGSVTTTFPEYKSNVSTNVWQDE
jgi:hypothetical protein